LVKGQFTGVRLKKQRKLLPNDPFFIIAKASEGGKFLPVFQSEVDRAMQWKPFDVSFQALCNAEADRPIRITFYNYRSGSAAFPIGYHDTNYMRMCESLGRTVTILDTRNADQGAFAFTDVSMMQKYSFYDYLRGGIHLKLIIAIDFTGSNKDRDDPTSLHFVDTKGDSLNQYERCFAAVGAILCRYDNDQLFTVLGFGAKVRGAISHCFPLTFDPAAPNVHGLDGIQAVYRRALGSVLLSGPTHFAPVIRFASQKAAEAFRESRTYTVLLIITHGVINEVAETKDAIVEAGRLPLSIIIVGVGDESFDAMHVLDSDDTPLVSQSGQKACRDLVQFVAFNRFADLHYSVLAQEVLYEVPLQVCEWAEMNGVYPN
jgi:hypothetical protein